VTAPAWGMSADSWRHLGSGCAAGIVADVVTYPVSTAKTRLQVQGSGGGQHGALVYRGTTNALWTIARTEGLRAWYSGLGSILIGSAPAQGLYFGAYELGKSFLGNGQSASGNFAAGVCAQLCGSVVWVPMDVVKERLQLGYQVQASEYHRGAIALFKSIVRNEGFRGLYRAFPIHQLTWAPFNGCYFMLYEYFKGMCIDAGYEDGCDNLEPAAQLCCGAAAAVMSSVITNPCDVIKTRLQVARANADMFPYTNSWQATRHLLKHEGSLALMDGAVARVAWLTPRLTICMGAYEYIKARLS